MNKHLYRIVFNDRRGQLMVVAETATGDGKSTTGQRPGKRSTAPYRATLRALAFALFIAQGLVIGLPPTANAQIVAYRNAPGNQQPTILNAGNGVPLINIQTPSGAGVSRNSYSQFDVQSAGAILNNSRSNAQTQLGGWVAGNPWLATGSARVILNEVVSTNPSQLRGYVEVAGSNAQVVIANPAGVTCSGCGFINANRVTLSTATPIVNGGGLDGYRVEGGTIRIEGAGLDASRVDYTDLIARAVEVNAGVWANDLKVTAGANQVDAANVQATAISGSGAAPAFAIDVARLGGMYAKKIVLVGTEAGVGVRNAGTIGAAAGEVVVTASGKLVNQGTLISGDHPLTVGAHGIDNAGTVSSERDLTLASVRDVVNTGLIHAGNELRLDAGGQLANRQGTLEGQSLAIHTDRLVNDGGTLRQNGTQALAVSAGHVANAAGALIGNVTASGSVSAPSVAASAATTRLADGVIGVRGDIDNAGTIAASGAVSLTVGAGLTNAGTLALNRLNASGESIRNSGAITAASARLVAPLLDNSGGTLAIADQLEIAAHDVANTQGTIRHSGVNAFSVALAGSIDNRSGQIASNGIDLKLSAAAIDNTGGRIEHAGDGALSLTTNRLDGKGGRIESRGGLVIAAADAILDGASSVGAIFAISAGALSNQGGRIAQTGPGSGSITAAGRFNNTAGSVASPGSAIIVAGEIDNRGSGKIATNGDLVLTATTGALANNGGTISSQRRIVASVAGELGNAGGQLVAGTDLALTSGGRVNNAGGTLGAVAGKMDATLGGALDNSGGRVEAGTDLAFSSNGLGNVGGTLIGQSVTIDSRQQAFDNSRGTVAAGGALAVSSGFLTNVAGRLQAAGTLTIDSHGQALANTNGNILGQTSVALSAGALDNSSGTIGAAETLTLNSASLTNRSGRITQDGAASGPITVAGRFDNIGGMLASAAALNLSAGEIDNRDGGKVATNGDLTLSATTGALANDGGTVSSKGRLVANIASELSNAGGQLVAGTDFTLTTGGRVNNANGTLGAVAGSLNATLGGALYNAAGRVEAASTLALSSGGLSNVGGTLIGQSVTIDSRRQAFDNSNGTVAAAGAGSTLSIASGLLTNVAGRLQAAGTLTIDSHGQTLANTNGNILGQTSIAMSAGALDNSSGIIGAAETLTLNAASLTNRSGRITQNGAQSGPITVAGRFDNTSGMLASAAALNLSAGEIDNRDGGKVATNGDLTLTTTTGALANDGGTVNSQGRIDACIAGELTNAFGQLVAGTDLELTTGGRVNNTGGTLGAVAGSLDATLGGALDNSGGRVEAATSLALSSNALSNVGGTLLGQSVAIDTQQQTFDNSRGTVSAGSALSVSSGTLTNVAGRLQAAGALTVDSHAQAIVNTGGGSILGQSSIALTAGAFDNSSGVIGAAETLTLNAASLTNRRGRITQNGAISGPITVAGRFDNTGGTLASAASLNVSTGELDNHDGGKIATNGDLTLTTTTGALINDGGTVNSLGRIDARISGDVGNASGQLVAGTDLELSTGGRVNNLSGTLGAVAGRVDATLGGALDNSGGRVEAATGLVLSSNGLSNVGGTLLGQSVAIDTRQQTFDNSRGTVSAASALNIVSGQLTNVASRLQAAGALTIDSHGQALDNTSGNILGQASVTLTAGAVDNSSGVIGAAETLTLSAASLTNRAGRITQNGAISGTITVAGRFDNTAGMLANAASLNLSTGELDNRSSGKIATNGDLMLTTTTGALINDGGTVNSLKRIDAHIAGELSNASGQFVAGTNLALTTSGRVNNVGGTLGAVAGSLDATLGGALDSTAGRVEAASILALSSNGLSNVGGTLIGHSVTIDSRQQAFDNSRGTVAAAGALTLSSGQLTNVAGRLQAAGALTIDSHGQELTNTNGGNILGQASIALSAGAVDNSSGLIASADTLAVTASSLANLGGRLSAQNGMTLRTGAALDNRSGDIQSGGDLSASATAIDNSDGLMRAAGTLTVSADRLINTSTNDTDQGLEGRSLVIAANAIDNRSGALRASDALTIDSAGTLDNTNGLISSSRTLAVRDANPVRTLAVTNTGGTIIAGTELSIRADRLSGDGRILSHGDMAVDLAADFVNTSEITADRNANVVTAGSLTNSGTLQAGSTLAVQAATLDNTAAGKIAGGALQIGTAGTLTNRGLIDGGDAFINAASVDNLGTGRIYGNHLAIAAATVNNHPEVGIAPVIAARERLDIGAWTIDNRDGALIFSAGDLAVGGVLDANHHAAGQAGAITNASATIEALGNLAINTTSLINRKTTFATTQITSGTPEVGIALLDYAPELQFHWGYIKTGTAPWRNYIRERYLDAISKLLGGGPDASLVYAFNPLPPTPPYNPDFPIGPGNLPPYNPDLPIGPYNQPPPAIPPPYQGDMYDTIWGDLTGYSGPVGGGLDEAYRSRLAAAVNAPVPWEFDDSHKLWQLLIETIAAERPEYIERMAKNLAARGPLQYAYRQICVDTDDCDYVSNVVSTSVSHRDVVSADSPAAVIRAGGNATINATALENRHSVIQSGGDMVLTGATLTNVGTELYLLTDTTSTSRLWHWRNRDQGATTSASSTQTLIGSAPAIISAGGALTGSFSDRIDNIAIRQNAARVVGQTGSTPATAGATGVGTTASGGGTAQTATAAAEAVSSTARAGSAQTATAAAEAVSSTARTGSAQTATATAEAISSTARAGDAQTASGAGLSVSSTAGTSSANTASTFGAAPARITRVAATGAASGPSGIVATAALSLTLPASRLMHVTPDPTGRYLVETDPAFASYRTWLSSDYLLAALALDPALAQKRLGDGFYEQRLITEQVAQLTGRRFLSGYSSDEAQYRALMAAGATVAEKLQLVPGVALSEAQMARLTTDIVWLVEREVTQADGTTHKVLVPQVYAWVRDGDLDASGALIAANDVQLTTAGDLVTSGTIAGRQVVALTAENIADLRGRIAGRDVAVLAANDLTVLGGSVEAERTLVTGAGNDLTVASTTVDRDYQNDSTGTANSVKQTTIDRIAGLYVTGAGGTLIASAGNDLTLLAAVVGNAAAAGSDSGAGQTLLAAGDNLTLGTVTENSQAKTASRDVRWSSATRNEFGSAIQTSGDLALVAGQNLTARAASVNSAGALTAEAGRDLAIEAGLSSYETTYDSETSRGGFLSSRSSSQHDKVNTTTALSSTFGGDTVVLRAGQDIAIKGSNVVSDQGTILVAQRNLAIEAAQETHNESHFKEDKESGIFGSGGVGFTIGSRQQSVDQQYSATTAVTSTLGSIAGSVTLLAGHDYRQVGSDVLAPRGDIDISAQKVDIVEARETSERRTEVKSSQSGLTVAVSSPVIGAIQTAQQMSTAAGQTGGSRMLALAAAKTAMAAGSALDTIEKGQGSTINGKEGQIATGIDADGKTTSRDANAADKAGGINVSISVGSASSSSTSTQRSDTAAGSTVVAGSNVSITAAGAGAGSDLTIQGSRISAGNDVKLKAEDEIKLLAARNYSELHGSSEGSSASIGVSIGTDGLLLNVGASRASGNEDGNDGVWRTSQVSAGKTLIIESGGDTTLNGAVASGEQVVAKVGGNLSIASVQDTSQYDSKEQSLGGSISIGYGKVGGSLSASQSKVTSDYASVAEQSGIKAGDGGFQVEVKGTTDLKGAVIASTEQAVQDGKNRFATAGLTLSDIANKAEYEASSTSVNFGSSLSFAGKLTPSGTGVGIGTESGSAASTSRSGISGIAGNQSVRSGDAETGIAKIFDADKVKQDIAAQVQITQTFSQLAPKAAANYAGSQTASLKQQAASEPDPDKQAALLDEAKKWAPNGSYNIAMNMIIGAAGGNMTSSITKETLSWAASEMRQAMIEDSKKFKGLCDTQGNCISNMSGQSVGVNGDNTKIAGGRIVLADWCADNRCTKDSTSKTGYQENPDGTIKFNPGIDGQGNPVTINNFLNQHPEWRSPLGGFQGDKGQIDFFGIRIEYEKGSFWDKLAEAYAGTHDSLNKPIWYDSIGNSRNIEGTEKAVGEILNRINVGVATPFALSVLLPPEVWNTILATAKLVK